MLQVSDLECQSAEASNKLATELCSKMELMKNIGVAEKRMEEKQSALNEERVGAHVLYYMYMHTCTTVHVCDTCIYVHVQYVIHNYIHVHVCDTCTVNI